MAQVTRVAKLSAADAAALESRLKTDLPPDADWRSVAHARFSVKADGTVATCYNSGKLVVQSSDPDTWLARFVPGTSPEPSKARPSTTSGASVAEIDRPTMGADEAGKGDVFGPLVVAAVIVRPEEVAALRDAGVTDSKRMTDARIETLAAWIEREFPCYTIELAPPEYNERYTQVGNLNKLLADLHGEAMANLLNRTPTKPARIILDRFGNESLTENALAKHHSSREALPELVQETRAERHAPVAAASVLARAAFVKGIAASSDRCGVDLHKGAGEPTDRAASRVQAIGGIPLLEQVAKMHFKNIQRLGGNS